MSSNSSFPIRLFKPQEAAPPSAEVADTQRQRLVHRHHVAQQVAREREQAATAALIYSRRVI